ncbi:MAG TPA: hypothetical protein VKB50_20175 [Vicinamibacterales bacterium]|nr:hypothetical protein [Vicinamibacterales bacterium]
MTPQFLLIVREWLRPGTEQAYDENERRLATACATFDCPHPYLALARVDQPREIWWLNTFASAEERDGLDDAYARNGPLMSALLPLGKRKLDFREALSTTRAAYRPDLGGGAGLGIEGARFLIVSTTKDPSSAAVFESPDGEWFRIASAPNGTAAGEVAGRFGVGAMILAIQPQWSIPAESWVRADPDFWKPGQATP